MTRAPGRLARLILFTVLCAATVVPPAARSEQWVRQRTLYSPNPVTSGQFGWAIAAFGDGVVISDIAESTVSRSGAVYLFDGVTGALLQTFRSPVPSPARFFGLTVGAIGGLVWAGWHDGFLPPEQYLFDPVTGAVVTPIIDPTLPTEDWKFGDAVADVGGNVLVGEPYQPATQVAEGRAYLIDPFGSSGGSPGGALLLDLPSSEPLSFGRFGAAVAALGGDLLVGAPFELVLGSPGGAVYLLDGTTGALEHTFRSPGTDVRFGAAIAAEGGEVLIGAPGEGPLSSKGKAYLFTGDGTLLHPFSNPLPTPADQFGTSVALIGPRVAVGAPIRVSGGAGQVHIFDRALGIHLQTLVDPHPSPFFSRFGKDLAVVGKTLYVTTSNDATMAPSAGAVYMYAPCADAVIDPGEGCDDGNLVADDGCDPNCQPTGCGNGFVGAGEECDDGNTANGDCCSSTCTLDDAGSACTPVPPVLPPGICDGAGTCVAIPTLSEWGVLSLSLLMLIAVVRRTAPIRAH